MEEVDARWRIGVAEEECISVIDVDLDGRTHTLTLVAARTLTEKLTGLLAAAQRFADDEEARAAQARH